MSSKTIIYIAIGLIVVWRLWARFGRKSAAGRQTRPLFRNRKLQALSSLTSASLKMYFRNLSAVFFTMFIPVVLVVVFGFLSSGSGNAKIKIGMLNESSSPVAQQFVTAIQRVPGFQVQQGTSSQLSDQLNKNKIDLEIVVPPDFGRQSGGRLQPSTVYAYYNQARPQTGQTASLIVGQIVSGFNDHLAGTPQVVKLQSKGVSTSNLTEIDFILPGIIALSIMQLGIFSVSFAFISYKTTGMLRRLQVAPIHPGQFLVAQGFTRLVVAMMQVTLLFLLGVYFFHVHLPGIGSFFELLFFAILGTLVFLGFGFAVAGAAHDENQAAPLSNIISFPQLFLANIFFPNDSFPHWLKIASDNLPLAFLGDAMRRTANEGASIWTLHGDLLGLLIWGIIAAVIAVRVFSWE